MPESGNGTVVSCAADGVVRVAAIPQGCGGAAVETRRLACHRGRAHKLALEPGSPHCFLSCGEGGRGGGLACCLACQAGPPTESMPAHPPQPPPPASPPPSRRARRRRGAPLRPAPAGRGRPPPAGLPHAARPPGAQQRALLPAQPPVLCGGGGPICEVRRGSREGAHRAGWGAWPEGASRHMQHGGQPNQAGMPTPAQGVRPAPRAPSWRHPGGAGEGLHKQGGEGGERGRRTRHKLCGHLQPRALRRGAPLPIRPTSLCPPTPLHPGWLRRCGGWRPGTCERAAPCSPSPALCSTSRARCWPRTTTKTSTCSQQRAQQRPRQGCRTLRQPTDTSQPLMRQLILPAATMLARAASGCAGLVQSAATALSGTTQVAGERRQRQGRRASIGGQLRPQPWLRSRLRAAQQPRLLECMLACGGASCGRRERRWGGTRRHRLCWLTHPPAAAWLSV
jgi:hypothetical protein